MTSWLTSAGDVPLPAAMRWRRDPSIVSGFARSRGGHRPDDRLDAPDLPVVDLDVAQFLGDAGEHADEVAERAHLLDLLHLLEEVLERELALEQLGRRFLGLSFS